MSPESSSTSYLGATVFEKSSIPQLKSLLDRPMLSPQGLKISTVSNGLAYATEEGAVIEEPLHRSTSILAVWAYDIEKGLQRWEQEAVDSDSTGLNELYLMRVFSSVGMGKFEEGTLDKAYILRREEGNAASQQIYPDLLVAGYFYGGSFFLPLADFRHYGNHQEELLPATKGAA